MKSYLYIDDRSQVVDKLTVDFENAKEIEECILDSIILINEHLPIIDYSGTGLKHIVDEFEVNAIEVSSIDIVMKLKSGERVTKQLILSL